MKNRSKKTTIGIDLLIFLLVAGVIFFIYTLRKKELETQVRNLEIEEIHERKSLKTAQLEKQEKELKKQFANSQTLSEKKLIKEKLTSLQNTLFSKKE